LEKVNKTVNEKIATTTAEIKKLQDQMSKIKDKVSPASLEKIKQLAKKDEELKKKFKDWRGNSGICVRRSRRDWVEKFDGMRFSDSRVMW
jgi:predicted nuclease with TOPRIM domain